MMAITDTGLLVIWITLTALALLAILAAVVWAVRAGQFSDQDRARYLPLKSGIGPPAPRGEPRDKAGAAPASRDDNGSQDNVSH